jgi:hypothetical protein
MRGLLLVVLLVPVVAVADPAPPVAPPGDIAEVISAFKGSWTFDAKITGTKVPGMEKPLATKTTFTCKPVANNTAVACETKSKGSAGTYEGQFLVVYDPYSKDIHFMGVTSKYEVFDHHCTMDHGMAGKLALVCKPVKHGSGPAGDEVTNELSISWHDQGKTADFRSVTTLKSGGVITYDGTGKR